MDFKENHTKPIFDAHEWGVDLLVLSHHNVSHSGIYLYTCYSSIDSSSSKPDYL